MSKICTSPEQSRILIDIGIDIRTADMWYGNGDPDKLELGGWEDNPHDDDDVPAWSLPALLSLIPPINDNTYTLRGTLDGGALISFEEVTNVMYQEEEVIDSVCEMIMWLNVKGFC